MAKQVGVFLTQADQQVLQRLLDKERSRGINPPIRPPDDPNHPSTDCYLARIPENGIPGTDEMGTGTVGDADDIPGTEVCDIINITGYGTGSPLDYLFGTVPSLTLPVFNCSKIPVLSKYSIVVKEKFGRWMVPGTHISLAKATTDIGTSTTFTEYDWWKGSPLDGEVASGLPKPEIITLLPIDSGLFFMAIPVGNYVQAMALQCNIEL